MFVCSGKFGQVFKLVEKATKKVWAGKFIKAYSAKEKENVRQEIGIMNSLHHPKLVQCIDAFEGKSDIVMVLEMYVRSRRLSFSQSLLLPHVYLRNIKTRMFCLHHLHVHEHVTSTGLAALRLGTAHLFFPCSHTVFCCAGSRAASCLSVSSTRTLS